MKLIRSFQGPVIKVDDADFAWLSTYSWTVRTNRIGGQYAWTTLTDVNGKRVCRSMHRMLFDALLPKTQIDHVDHDGLNNQRTNLRACSNTENSRNCRRRSGRCLPKGVIYRRQCRKYQAQIYVGPRKYYLGTFSCPREAAHAYNKAAVRHFGEFAVLNPI